MNISSNSDKLLFKEVNSYSTFPSTNKVNWLIKNIAINDKANFLEGSNQLIYLFKFLIREAINGRIIITKAKEI